MPKYVFNPYTQKVELQRNFFADDEKLMFGGTIAAPKVIMNVGSAQDNFNVTMQAPTTDISTSDMVFKGQDFFASASTNLIGGDVVLKGGTGSGSTTENDGKVHVDGFQLEVKRDLDWGHIASSGATDDYGAYFTFRASGSTGTRRVGLQLNMEGTYTGSEYTQALGFFNSNPGTSISYINDTALFSYRPSGDRGIFGGSSAVSAGIKSGLVALAGGSNTENYGVWGAATITRTFGMNIGVFGGALNAAGVEFGGAFVLGSRVGQPVTRATSAALLADNSTLAEDILALQDNSVDVFIVRDGGNIFSTGQMAFGFEEYEMTINGSVIPSRIAIHNEGAQIQAELELHRHSDSVTNAAVIFGAKSRGSEASPTIVQDGDNLFDFGAVGYDGTDYALAARLDIEVDGTPGDNDMPGRFVFKTSASGTQSPTEALRIDSNQIVTTSSGRIVKTTRVTTTYTVLIGDHKVFANTDSAGYTVTLPAGVEGQTFVIKNTGSSVNTLTLAPDGSEHLLGDNSSFVIEDGEDLEITYNAIDGWY